MPKVPPPDNHYISNEVEHNVSVKPSHRDVEQGPSGLYPPHQNTDLPRLADPQHYQPTLDEDTPDPWELAPVIAALRPDPPEQSHHDQQSSSATLNNQNQTGYAPAGAKRLPPDWQTVERPLPDVHYGPKWCRFCHINKPDRTHHCRHCGTCVMQFDRKLHLLA